MATELGKAYVQIIPSARGITGSIQNVLNGESVAAGKSAGLNIVSGIKNMIVAGGIGVAIKKTLDAGGDLQQSLGGIETMYGEAADQAKAYANAAAAAGLSANDYAEQAVSFGAALKQAFGGDVVAAAESANTAIMDMQDNSAKMGTDIGAIQNAYQGFAKQNYTMLDNLKLGYGGTKGEMERLLADAEKLSGVHYDIDNLGDVYSAIHVIQEDLGLTGVAADEAKTTFTGSMQAMKASATNLLAHLALGEDITKDFENLAGNTKVFLTNNLIPMVVNIIKSLPSLLQSAWGELYSAGMDLLGNLTQGIKDNLPTLIENGLNALMSFTSTLHDNAGDLIDAGLEMIKALVQGLAESLPVMIETIPTIVSNIANIINDNMPKIIETGFSLITTLVKGIISAIPVLVQNLPLIIKAIWDVFAAVNWMDIGSGLIADIGNGIKGLFNLIPDLFRALVQKAWDIVRSIDWLGLGKNIINFIGDGIKSLLTLVPNALRDIATTAFNAFKSINWLELGSNIINGIVNGIRNGMGAIAGAAMDAAKSALNSAKNFLQIHSPSRVFQNEVGEQIDAGIALGIEDNVKDITDAMKTASKASTDAFNTETPKKSTAPLNVTMNIYGAEGQDIDELADAVAVRLSDLIDEREAVFA